MSGTFPVRASYVVGPHDDSGSSSRMTRDRSRARGHATTCPSDCASCVPASPCWSRAPRCSRCWRPRTAKGPPAANLLLAAAYCVPVVWRRRAPFAALAAALGGVLVMALTLTSVESLFTPYVAILAIVYAAGADRDASLALVLAVVPAIVLTLPDHMPADFVFPALTAAFAWFTGRMVRSRTRLTGELHEAAARLAEAGE